jgi:hypothetical protein
MRLSMCRIENHVSIIRAGSPGVLLHDSARSRPPSGEATRFPGVLNRFRVKAVLCQTVQVSVELNEGELIRTDAGEIERKSRITAASESIGAGQGNGLRQRSSIRAVWLHGTTYRNHKFKWVAPTLRRISGFRADTVWIEMCLNH